MVSRAGHRYPVGGACRGFGQRCR